jgi:hypothetical protein
MGQLDQVLGRKTEPRSESATKSATPPHSMPMASTTTALVVTDAAVKQHLLHLYDKLGIEAGGERRRVALARRALQLGLVDGPGRLTDMRSTDVIADGREAFARHEWERAATLLAEAEAPDDLVLLGDALLWSNQHEQSFRVKERAYQAYLRAGERRSAGFVAVLLTVHNTVRLDMAVAGGWLAKAQNLLDGEPACREYGYLSLVRAMLRERAGDWGRRARAGGNHAGARTSARRS